MNGNEYYNQQMQSQAGLASQLGYLGVKPAPKSIMQQLDEKSVDLRERIAKSETNLVEMKAELAQCERMIKAAEEPKSDG